MQSSNPLLVVGISAAIAIGSTTAATAKTESPADLQPVDSKENNAFEVSSLKPEPPEQWFLSQANEAPQDEVDIDLNLLDDSEPSSSDADLAQEPESSPEPSLEESEAEAEEAIGEELEGEVSEEGLPALPEGEADVEIEAIEEDLPEAEAEGEAEVEAEEPVADDEAEAEVEESSEESEEVEGEAEPVLETDPALEEDTLEPLPDTDSTPTTDEEPTPSAPTADPGSAPDYLDPDPNPLSFPTDPSEVEIVGTQPITLIQAIELGIRNNEDLQRARLELQRSQAALRETQAENFPTVDLGADLTLQGSEQPDTQFNPLTGEQEADGTELQTSLGLGGALQANYAIFTSGRRSALIQAAEREVRFQELAVESTTEDLILQVTQAYYDLQEADEQVQIFQAALDEAERSLRDAEALERAGVGTRFDVLQAQVDVANAQQDLRNQLSQQEVARRRLVEQLNLSQSVTLAAAEPVEVAGVWDLTLEQSIVEAFRNRAELEQQLVQREIAERNRRASLATLGPQVNLSAQYGLNNTLASDPDSIAEDFGFLSSFQVQLGVSISLFDGGRARAQARQAEANIAIAESQFANVRDQIRLEVEEAYSQLDANFENIQTTALAVQQAEEALRLARLRFQAGVGTQTDVLRSQTELTRSRFNNLQAILNYNRALAALRRSVSNFPEGYLNEVP
ncbi:transporter [filamentous cyanobacterium CCP1]|nr:transporter [filamentous cyanobacterium CCP2]PSB63482.1 transporter [filamentous cyanobacterium CCP1]